MNTDIIIPTIRSRHHFKEFYERWGGFKGYHIIVIEDRNRCRIKSTGNISSYCWKDIEETLKDNSWIISRKDGGIRCFGLLKSESDYIVMLDDDCYPHIYSHIEEHIEILRKPSYPYYFNTLYKNFPRGYPFELRKGVKTVLNHGLWLQNADLDAMTQIYNNNYSLIPDNTTIPYGIYYPMSAMNIAFRSSIKKWMYMFIMNKDLGIGRYDDLLCGWVSKKLIDNAGWGVRTGSPYVIHEKLSDWKTNLLKEAVGYTWQYSFVRMLSKLNYKGTNYAELADKIEREINRYPDLKKYIKFFELQCKAMRIWFSLFQNAN